MGDPLARRRARRAAHPQAAIRAAHPPFLEAVLEDARVTAAFRAERHRFRSTADALLQAARLLVVSDAYIGQVCYRAKAAMQRRGVPVLPRIAHRLAIMTAQVCIGDPVVVQPGLYLPHGQVVIDGVALIERGVTIRPWVTVGLKEGNFMGATIERQVQVGTGAKVIGPVRVGRGALIGANAVVVDDVPAGAVAAGVPARVIRTAAEACDRYDLPVPTVAPTSGVDDVLSTAKRLARRGRWDDAVAALEDANRREPHPKLARRALRYRHEAYDARQPTTAVTSWPRRLPDPFPGVTGVPEVDAPDLSADLLGGAIVNHGCLLVRNLVAAAPTARLVDEVDRALEAAQAWMAGPPAPETAPWFEIFKPTPPYSVGMSRRFVVNGGGVLAADSPPAMISVIDTLAAAGLRPALEGYLGERPALSAKKTTLRRVPADSGSDWHQDGAFLGQGIRTVNVWVALSACGVDAPGLDVVPRRLDLVDTGTEGAVFDWSVGRPVVERAAAEVGVVRPAFEAGDALLFDDRFLHSTAVSPGMTRPRYAIEAWFFAPSAYPSDQVPILF